MKLHEKITQSRKKIGMSQIDLADAMGVSRQSVSKWETGEANPEIGKLPLLAKTLNVSVDWLLSDDESVKNNAQSEAEIKNELTFRSYPEWVECLPNWIGRSIRRFGWMYGLRMVVGGFIFALLGVFMRIILNTFLTVSMKHDNDFANVGGFFNEFNEKYEQLTQASHKVFTLFSSFSIVFGIVLMIIGIVLTVKLRKWSRRELQS